MTWKLNLQASVVCFAVCMPLLNIQNPCCLHDNAKNDDTFLSARQLGKEKALLSARHCYATMEICFVYGIDAALRSL